MIEIVNRRASKTHSNKDKLIFKLIVIPEYNRNIYMWVILFSDLWLRSSTIDGTKAGLRLCRERLRQYLKDVISGKVKIDE